MNFQVNWIYHFGLKLATWGHIYFYFLILKKKLSIEIEATLFKQGEKSGKYDIVVDNFWSICWVHQKLLNCLSPPSTEEDS